MPITPEQVDAWRSQPSETENLEFKEAKNQFDTDKLFSYCVALCNEGGGHLLFGIENVPPRNVTGSAAFPDTGKISERIFRTVGFRVDVEEVQHPSGRVLVFTVPPRPIGTPCHLDGKYFMRSGESLVCMTPDRLRKIFEEGKPDWLEEYSKEDISIDELIELLDVDKFFRLMELPYPADQYGVAERLASERLICQNGDRISIKRIGALLLARKMDEFPELSRKVPRVIVYGGKSKLNTKLDQLGSKGYAVGFSGLVDYIMSQLPQNEVIKNAIRVESRLVPDVVIRELVANALIHQDFSMSGTSVIIEIYSNRIDISNPGKPIIPESRFIDMFQSRNERLAQMMRHLRICEEKGSGIKKVCHFAEVYQLPAPSIVSDQLKTQVTIFGPMKIQAMDRADRVRACYQHCALKYVMSERMTNQSLRSRFGLPESKSTIASQAIANTVEEKLIRLDEKVGTSRKYARYVPFWA